MTKKGDLLDLLLVNREGLESEVAIGGYLGHSDHEAIEFKICGEKRKSASKTSTLDMRRGDFKLLRELVKALPTSHWPSFGQQHVHLQSHQGLALLDMVETSSSFSQEPSLWPLSTKNQAMTNQYSAQSSIGVEAARTVEDNKNSFPEYIYSKRQSRNNIIPLQDEDGHLRNRDMEKADVFNTFFASVFNAGDGSRGSECPELGNHGCENDKLPVDPELMWEPLLQLYSDKSMGPDGIHPKVQELAHVITMPLSMIFEWS
ncbi:hypothetical protein DUI87_01062 [Hirundo rustica rustica]|uniref:Endonuclease/exonuclease/phosphatase domain-containing protein n=1 Tax=Hirundo rustica rustica TaxID=333673 RepID=A0A3M0L5C4_HIRRU|nr:hypothetical protein DUI87_01062 [Hirundo rustica rustica]